MVCNGVQNGNTTVVARWSHLERIMGPCVLILPFQGQSAALEMSPSSKFSVQLDDCLCSYYVKGKFASRAVEGIAKSVISN